MKLKCPSCMKHLGAAVGTLVVLALSLEAGLRLHERSRKAAETFDVPESAGWLPSAYCFVEGKPLWRGEHIHPDTGRRIALRTNSLGLRGAEIVVPKPPDRYRVLVLGDESTFAPEMAEEQTFCRQLEALLQRAVSRRVEVINAGVPGHCPLLSYLLLKHSLAGLQPDCILLVFDMSDVADDHRCRRYSRCSATGEPLVCRHPLLGSSSAGRRSAGGSLLLEWLKRQAARLSTGGEMPDEQSDINTPAGRYAWTQDRPPDWSVYARQALQPVLRMKQLADRLSADFVVTAMPLPWQVSATAGNTAAARQRFGIPLNTLVRNVQPFRQIEEFCRQEKIVYVSVLPAFRQSPRPAQLFLQRVPRLSAEGHQLFARVVSRFLLQGGASSLQRLPGEGGSAGGAVPAFSASARRFPDRERREIGPGFRRPETVPPDLPPRRSLGGLSRGRYD